MSVNFSTSCCKNKDINILKVSLGSMRPSSHSGNAAEGECDPAAYPRELGAQCGGHDGWGASPMQGAHLRKVPEAPNDLQRMSLD